MRGLWTEETQQLALKVASGNPGALRVIDELLSFSKWYQMMQWCEKNLKGSDLWAKYKDEFHQDSDLLGYWIQQRIWEDEGKHTIKPYFPKCKDYKL
jgi:hypothetical protein